MSDRPNSSQPLPRGRSEVAGWAAHRQTIRRGAKFDFEHVVLAGPGGRMLARDVVRHPGAVVILPILDGPGGPQIVMIRNLRVALEAELLELPAGTLERGEDPAACAARELMEETGYEALTIRPLGRFYTTPGLTDELMHAFVATGLRSVGQDLEDDESIRVEPVPLAAAMACIDAGELVDAKSILTILWACRRGVLSGVTEGI